MTEIDEQREFGLGEKCALPKVVKVKRQKAPLERAGLVAWPAGEVKVQWLGERPRDYLCTTPDAVANYWRESVEPAPWFRPDCECLVVIMLNTRRKIRCHAMVSMGTLDSILAHAREIFRAAIMTSAAAIVVAHNHPSGDPTPSEADIKITREIKRAGELLRIEMLDHVIIGQVSEGCKGWASLRELGYLYN